MVGDSRQQFLAIGAVVAVLLLLLSTRWTSSKFQQPIRHFEQSVASSRAAGFRPLTPLPASHFEMDLKRDFLASGSREEPPPPPPLSEQQPTRGDDDDDPWASAALRQRPEVRKALAHALRRAMQEAEHNASVDPLELLAKQLLQRRLVLGGNQIPPRLPSPPPPPANPMAGASAASAIEARAGGSGGADASSIVGARPESECRGRGTRARRRCKRAVAAHAAAAAAAAAVEAAGSTDGGVLAANRSWPMLPYPPTAAHAHGLPPKLPTAAMWPSMRRVFGSGAHSSWAVAGGTDSPDMAPDFRSLGRVAPYRGGDLEQPGELARAAAARSYRGELILTYGNEVGTAWIANLVFSLRQVGIDHSLVIVMSDEHCRALARAPWLISCAWSSWDFGQTGTGTGGAGGAGGAGAKKKRYEGQQCKNKYELRRLWYSRHHYMSRIIEETGLNVAVIDGDMSVRRDFYPALKAAPLAAHNLIYTLDHGPTCGDLNVGFAYCQRCAPRGRAQWVIDEGLRREGYFCGGDPSEFGNGGRFWNASDSARATSGPHHWQQWASARDQKLYSDVVGGSCCGAPQHRLMFPSSFKVLDQYAFMRQFGQHAKCMTMIADQSNGLQTWWHQLLQGAENEGGPVAAETVAIATGQLASGWHGTGQGEMAGWAGHWHYKPPAIAHFVGGAPAGGKVDLMQGLSWWLYEADVVAHAVMEETGKKVCALAEPGCSDCP
jgi:hypothetical protein